MQLLPGTDPDDLGRHAWGNCLSKIGDTHGRNLRDEDLPALHAGKTFKDEVHAILQPQPKSRHAWIRNREFLRPLCRESTEEWNNRSPAADNIAIADDREPCFLCADEVIRSRKELIRTKFCCTV